MSLLAKNIKQFFSCVSSGILSGTSFVMYKNTVIIIKILLMLQWPYYNNEVAKW